MTPPAATAVAELAALSGVQSSFEGTDGRAHPADEDVLLAILGAILGGSLFLRTKNLGVVALCCLGLIAVPALGLALILVTTLIFNPRWN